VTGKVFAAWYINGMRTAIDSAGRVVIPKALREALGLTAGQPLEIAERDGRLEIVPAATPMRLVDEDGDGVAAVADADMPVLTAEMVRDTLEHTRR
jgi:AbrB family looped-hinge helix DNA binding protein